MKILLVSFYDIVYFLIIILTIVTWYLIKIYFSYSWGNRNSSLGSFSFYYIENRITPNKNFLIEFVWTILPMLIFILVFIPLIKLLRIIGYNDIYFKNSGLFDNLLNFDSDSVKYSNWYSQSNLLSSFDIEGEVSSTFHSNVIKVIGNQWYWMYESVEDYNLYGYEDGVLFSYMSDFDKVGIDLGVDFISNSSTESSAYFNKTDILDSWSDKIRLLSTDFCIWVPKNTLVSFFISSYDVLHCWAIPSAGIKVDACPGRIASANVIFLDLGYYYGQCSELCGFLHGFMPICLKVV